MKILIVTGMSGAGRTQATKFLEDLGYFCIDNLPPMLLPKFGDLYRMNKMQTEKLALVMDVRSGEFYNDLLEFMDLMDQLRIDVKIIYLDCSDEVLFNRYRENRRNHPLAESGNNLEGIAKEREKLFTLKGQSDYVIDTTHMTVWDLKREISKIMDEDGEEKQFNINLISFGYKHGLPYVCDLVFDVRFIPNPYYRPELRHLTGEDEKVSDYVLNAEASKDFIRKTMDLLIFLLPLYQQEGKETLTIGFGCTGGKHRSVAISKEIGRLLANYNYETCLEHRDIGK